MLGYERNCAVRGEEKCEIYFYTEDKNSFTIDGALPTLTQVKLTPITITTDFNSNRNASKLYIVPFTVSDKTFSEYSHRKSNNGQETPFARYITFKGMNDLPTSLSSEKDIHHISSTVLFQYGGKTGEVSLESFITNPS